MQISFINKIPKTNKFFVLPLFEDIDWSKTAPKEFRRLLTNRKNANDFKAKAGETLLLVNDSATLPSNILFFGLGKSKKLKSAKIRNHAAAITKSAKSHQKSTVTLSLPEQLNKYMQELAEGFALSAYNPNLYLTGKNKREAEKKQSEKTGGDASKTRKNTKSIRG